MDWSGLVLSCAVFVAPDTMMSVIQNESGGDPLSIHVNKLSDDKQPKRIKTVDEAVAITERYLRAGYSVDMGLMQVNSRNLPMLGVSVAEAFEPCQNVRMGAAILAANYAQAAQKTGPGQVALLAALSAYNTGNFYEGFLNGYVAKYAMVPSGLVAYAQGQKSNEKRQIVADRKSKVRQPTMIVYN